MRRRGGAGRAHVGLLRKIGCELGRRRAAAPTERSSSAMAWRAPSRARRSAEGLRRAWSRQVSRKCCRDTMSCKDRRAFLLEPVLHAFGVRKDTSYAEIVDGKLDVRMGSWFHESFPLTEVACFAPFDRPWWGARRQARPPWRRRDRGDRKHRERSAPRPRKSASSSASSAVSSGSRWPTPAAFCRRSATRSPLPSQSARLSDVDEHPRRAPASIGLRFRWNEALGLEG